jgi:hypothetical protein
MVAGSAASDRTSSPRRVNDSGAAQLKGPDGVGVPMGWVVGGAA